MVATDTNYLSAELYAKIYFLCFEFPVTEGQYAEVDTYEGEDGCTINSYIEVHGHPLMVSLHLSRDLHVYVNIKPKFYLSAGTKDKVNACLQIIREALPSKIKASLQGDMIKFSSCVWDKSSPCETETLDLEVGKLLVIIAACMDSVIDRLCGERSFPDPNLLRYNLVLAEKRFCEEIREKEHQYPDLDIKNDESTLTADLNDKADTDADDNDLFDPDVSSFIMELIKESEKRHLQDEMENAGFDDPPAELPEYRWLSMTDFTPREKDILTFFKTQMEKRKEK